MKLSDRTTSTSSPLVRWMTLLFAALASLPLAVALLAVLVVVLVWATLLESRYGMAAAHFGVYDTDWFLALGTLLAINVFCAMSIRFPWRRRQTGFVVTHAGILFLLAGCLISRMGGIEAQLPVYEGQAANRAYLDSHHFELHVTANDERPRH